MNLSLEQQNPICPKCQYARKTTDIGPDYQCASCGVVYEKYIHHQEVSQHPENSHLTHKNPHGSTPQANLSGMETVILVVFIFLALGVEFTLNKADLTSDDFHRPFGFLGLFVLSGWLIYRIVNALQCGVLYTRGRYSFKVDWYYRETNPYMFWQTIIMWILGIVAMWTVVVFLDG